MIGNADNIDPNQLRRNRVVAVVVGSSMIVALIAVVFALVTKTASEEKILQLEQRIEQIEQESLAAKARAEKAEASALMAQRISEEQRRIAMEQNRLAQAELEKCRKGKK